MKFFISFVVLFLGYFLSSSNLSWWWSSPQKEIPTVPDVNITQYLGIWYEIVRLPFIWEYNCYCVEAYYTLKNDGNILVNNTCRKGSVTGNLVSSIGTAWKNENSTSKYNIQFFWPFTGPYWILKLADNYSYSLIGSDLSGLWILSRTPTLDESTVNDLISYASSLGYPVHNIIRTNQTDCLTSTNYEWLSNL